ncbi:chitinase [Cryptosporangium sp. NPDC051539]|uniref:chitinase n=1 Tax=Cryptosporangium sp. NPDC051539 TaxID=3363962 RepID=UPI0037BC9960
MPTPLGWNADGPQGRRDTSGQHQGPPPGFATQRAGRHRRSSTPLRVAAVAAVLVVLAAGSAFAYHALTPAPQTHPQAAPPPKPSPKPKPPVIPQTGFAPYVDMGYYPLFDLAKSVKTTGVNQYILGFIIAGTGCTPTWSGDTPINDPDTLDRVEKFRAAGGEIRISFGGAAGTELASACDNVTDLTRAYQLAIDTYGATMIDFDIEGAELADRDADVLRGQAIALLEKNAEAAGKKLNVSLTLPVNPSGFTASPGWMLTAAADAHATIHVVNIMAMDYGRWAAPDPEGNMGNYAIQAMTNAKAKIQSAFGLTSEEAWRRIAVTPLIGINSPTTEVFSIADAVKVAAFAKEKHIAFVSMWAITRDQPCPPGVEADADTDACAGNATSPFVFTKAFTSASATSAGD